MKGWKVRIKRVKTEEGGGKRVKESFSYPRKVSLVSALWIA